MKIYFLKLHWQILFTKIDEEPFLMQYSYTSKGYLEPHNSHPFQLQSQILTKLKYFPNIGEPQLAAWCNEVINDENENIKGFARGILRDFQAVYQGFVSNWSNGPVEGQVNRLKNIKRQMYGRAGFELLRKRVVITSQR